MLSVMPLPPYGTLVAWARTMGLTKAADLLQRTFDEEKATDEKLLRKGVVPMKLRNEEGIIKYGIAWFLGVPISVLVLIFLLARGC